MLPISLFLACSEYQIIPKEPASDAPRMGPDEIEGVCIPPAEDHSPLAPDGSYAWEESIDETRTKFRDLVAGYGLDREPFTVMTVSSSLESHVSAYFMKEGQILMVAGDERQTFLDEYEHSEKGSFLENFYDTHHFPDDLPAVVCNALRSENLPYYDLFLMTQFYVGNEIPVNWYGDGISDGLYANFLYGDSTAWEGDEQKYFLVAEGTDGTGIYESWDSEDAAQGRDGRLGSALERMEEATDNLNDLAEDLSVGWEENPYGDWRLSYGLWLCQGGECH